MDLLLYFSNLKRSKTLEDLNHTREEGGNSKWCMNSKSSPAYCCLTLIQLGLLHGAVGHHEAPQVFEGGCTQNKFQTSKLRKIGLHAITQVISGYCPRSSLQRRHSFRTFWVTPILLFLISNRESITTMTMSYS